MMMETFGELEEKEEETTRNNFPARHTSWNRRLLLRLFFFFSVLHANVKLSEEVLIKNQLVAFKASLHLTFCCSVVHAHTHSHTLTHTFAILCACWAV